MSKTGQRRCISATSGEGHGHSVAKCEGWVSANGRRVPVTSPILYEQNFCHVFDIEEALATGKVRPKGYSDI